MSARQLILLKRFMPPLIYLGGIGALMLADVLASSALEIADVAVWSRVRAINGILAVVCLLGLDQFLLRHPEEVRRVRGILFVQIPLASVAAALIGHAFSQPVLMMILIATFSSVSIAVSQFHRGRGRLLAAQMSAQSWKMIFLAGIGYYAWSKSGIGFENLIVICAIISLIVIFLFSLIGKNYSHAREGGRGVDGLGTVYGISLRLMAISTLTTLSIYLEQLLVNGLGSDHDAAVYFTHATYFLFSASLINGYLSFLAIPWAKSNVEKFENIMSKWMGRTMLAAAVYVVFVQGAASIAWHILTPAVGEIDFPILIAFSISAWSRTIYTYPSAFFGAFGEKDQYTTVTARYALSLLIAGALFLVLWVAAGLSLVHAVAWASTSNWLLRTFIGIRLVRPVAGTEVRL